MKENATHMTHPILLPAAWTHEGLVLPRKHDGGNSDVVAAVAGALAGAHYSASAIPTLWRNSLMKKQLIEDCADRLLTHALLDLGA